MQSLSIDSNGILNIIQAELFQKLQEKYPNRTIISLIFYYDEFEVNDHSQTGTHKIGAVYYFLCVYHVYHQIFDLILLIYKLHYYYLIVSIEKNLEIERLFCHSLKN